MTLYEFNTLSENEKAEATWSGTFLIDRKNGDLKYCLYSVGEFFVEVTYNAKDNKILGFRSFKTKRLLEKYLEKIKIIYD